MNTYQITYSVGTSRYNEKRYVKKVRAANLRGAAAHGNAIEARPDTTVVSITLTSEVYA